MAEDIGWSKVLFYRYARGVWVIMSAPGVKLLTPTAATVVNSFLLRKGCPP